MQMRAVILAFILLYAAPCHAHPHAWVTVKSAPIFDDAGRLIAIRQIWAFDQYYTQSVLEGSTDAKQPIPSQEKMTALATQNLNNLKDYNYFTTVTAQGKSQLFAGVEAISSSYENHQFVMSFTLLLAEPAAPPVQYRIFDPSYYIEMRHASRKSITMPEGTGCSAVLEEAAPEMEYINLAQSLDKNATAPASLGSVFAQTISLGCP